MIVSENIVSFLKIQPRVTVGFSLGKDSLCCATILRNLKVEYIPIYFYIVPDLEFIEKTIILYEKLLNIKIIRLPHPMMYDFLRHQDFQYPKMIDYLEAANLPKLTFEQLTNCYLESIGEENLFDVVGMRACESFNRRKYFQKYSTGIRHDERKIFPIFNWSKGDVLKYLSVNKIPLSDDYKIWNRSYDGMKYQFLIGVKNHYPEDYKKIMEYFPLLDVEIFRYEQNKKYFK